MARTRTWIEYADYNRPKVCEECGGIMIFKGVGEYQCEDCKALAYDDYGKVRLYIEKHKGANAAKIEAETGVSQKSIRAMLKEGRLEVTADSPAYLRCESCGKNIRSGRLCKECEIEYHRKVEAEERQERKKNLQQGFAKVTGEAIGERRFRRGN